MPSTSVTDEHERERPGLGIGVLPGAEPEACADAVATALETGYRHVDTAQRYRNEESVGRGIARADLPREEVVLATKVWIDRPDREGVLSPTREGLDRLGVDAVDLLYVHGPADRYDPAETLPAMDEVRERGLADRIGVSNFLLEQVDEARERLDAPVFANQIEVHPLLPRWELVEGCHERGIEVVAYSPLARGRVFDVPVLTEIAERHGVSEAQVSLAWLRERDIVPIPKATSAAHVRDNWASHELTLTDAERERIDAIDRRERTVDPEFGPWNDGDD